MTAFLHLSCNTFRVPFHPGLNGDVIHITTHILWDFSCLMDNLDLVKFDLLTYTNILEALPARHNVIICMTTLKHIMKESGLFWQRYDASEDHIVIVTCAS